MDGSDRSSKILARIPKTERAEVRVTRQIWRGREVIDVRVWYQPRGSTEFVASRKGATIDAQKLPELVAALSLECGRSD